MKPVRVTGESLRPIRVCLTRRELDLISIAAARESRSVSRFLALRALSYAIGNVKKVEEEPLGEFEYRRDLVAVYVSEADHQKLKRTARNARCTVSAWIRSAGLR